MNNNISKVFVVTSGEYSSYDIEAVFLDKSKAELYCQCHRNCTIEEYPLCDNNIYTPYYIVVINYRWNLQTDQTRIDFYFETHAKEDCKTYIKNRLDSRMYGGFVNINSSIRLYPYPSEEVKNQIRNKYTKAFQDYQAQMKYILSEYNIQDIEDRKKAVDELNLFLKSKFCEEE